MIRVWLAGRTPVTDAHIANGRLHLWNIAEEGGLVDGSIAYALTWFRVDHAGGRPVCTAVAKVEAGALSAMPEFLLTGAG